MKKEKFSLGRLKKIPRNQLLIGGLAGVLLLVIAMRLVTGIYGHQTRRTF